ncbi:unnamed protein product, partial [Rhizoctonia solani]
VLVKKLVRTVPPKLSRHVATGVGMKFPGISLRYVIAPMKRWAWHIGLAHSYNFTVRIFLMSDPCSVSNGGSHIPPPSASSPALNAMDFGAEELGTAVATAAIYLLGGPSELAIATGMATAISTLARVARIMSPVTSPTLVLNETRVEDNVGQISEDKEESDVK